MLTRRVRLLALPVLAGAALAGPAVGHAGIHAKVIEYAVSNDPSVFAIAVGAADFNGDGRTDLAAAGLSTGGGDLTVLFGRGDGTFADGDVYDTDPRPGAVGTADFDEDGYSDMVLTSDSASRRLTVLFGAGDSSFTGDTFDVGTVTNVVAVGDFDGDDHADVAAASPGVVLVLLGDGDGGFTAPVSYATGGAGYGTIGAGDFDGDGRDDVVAAPGPNNNSVAVLLGNADGTLQGPRATTLTSCCVSGIAVGRFDADQRSDVVLTYAFSPSPSVLLAGADGTLGAPASLPGSGSGAVVGDVDRDGREDLALGSSNAVTILAGRGDGTFAAFGSLPGSSQLPLELGADLNGDGYDDLVLSNPSAPSVLVAVNAPGVATPTTALSFGALAVGATSPPQTLTLTNDGQPPLLVSMTALGGANAGDFRVTGDSCTGRSIPAGAACSVSVTSTPGAAGGRTADLAIWSNGVEAAKRIALSSAGVAAASPADVLAPTVTASVPRQKLRTVRRRGLKVVVGCSEACAVRLRLGLTRSLARRVVLPRAYVGARGTASLAAAGKATVRLTFTRRLRVRLAGLRSAQFALRITATDAAGNERTATRTPRVRR